MPAPPPESDPAMVNTLFTAKTSDAWQDQKKPNLGV